MSRHVVRGSFSILLVASLFFAFQACGGGGGPSSPDDDDDQLPAGTVGTTGGTVQLNSGAVTVVVPAGAVSSNVQLTAQAGTGPTNSLLISGSVVDLGPSGTQFAQPVTVTLSYDAGSLPTGVVENDLRLHKVIGGVWTEISGSTVSAGANTVSGQVSSFSTFGALALAVSSVSVTPASSTIPMGGSVQLSASVQSASSVTLQRTVTWGSSDESVATVSESGLVTPVGVGTATITATADGVSGTASVEVTDPVATVAVDPAENAMTVGGTVQLSTTVTGQSGNPITGKTVTWNSGTESVATVSGTGLVTAVAPGTSTITATVEGVDGTAEVTVTDPIASVDITDAVLGVVAGGTLQLGATASTQSGGAVTNPSVAWGTSDENTATVDGTGLVTGVAPGVVTITATVGGIVATVNITITMDWTSWQGTWAGTWVNTTYSSTDAISVVLTVDIASLSVTIVVDIDGPVLGSSDPGPFTVIGTLGATSVSAQSTLPLHGPIDVTGTPSDISLAGNDVPVAGIDSWTSSGSTTTTQYTGTFTVTFSGGGTAQGTATMTKQ